MNPLSTSDLTRFWVVFVKNGDKVDKFELFFVTVAQFSMFTFSTPNLFVSPCFAIRKPKFLVQNEKD